MGPAYAVIVCTIYHLAAGDVRHCQAAPWLQPVTKLECIAGASNLSASLNDKDTTANCVERRPDWQEAR